MESPTERPTQSQQSQSLGASTHSLKRLRRLIGLLTAGGLGVGKALEMIGQYKDGYDLVTEVVTGAIDKGEGFTNLFGSSELAAVPTQCSDDQAAPIVPEASSSQASHVRVVQQTTEAAKASGNSSIPFVKKDDQGNARKTAFTQDVWQRLKPGHRLYFPADENSILVCRDLVTTRGLGQGLCKPQGKPKERISSSIAILAREQYVTTDVDTKCILISRTDETNVRSAIQSVLVWRLKNHRIDESSAVFFSIFPSNELCVKRRWQVSTASVDAATTDIDKMVYGLMNPRPPAPQVKQP